MIIIDHVLVSDQVVEEQFVCDLNKCKGSCCEDGDAGAPLENQEKEYVKEFYEIVKPYMSKEGIKEVETVGQFLYDREFGWVTPTINGAFAPMVTRMIKISLSALLNRRITTEKFLGKNQLAVTFFQ